MHQRLPKVKATNTSENLLNEIHQIIYFSLYWAKKNTKKLYNYYKNFVIHYIWITFDTTFTNSENRKTSDPHRLLLDLSDKTKKKLKRSDKYAALSNLSIYLTWRNIKMSYKSKIFKMSAPAMNLNYLIEHFLYQIFKIILSIWPRNIKQLLIIL